MHCSICRRVDKEILMTINKNGYELGPDPTLLLVDDDEPFGQGKRAYVTEKYDNGQIRFEIGFVNGLKDGKVEFWQTNGLPELTGSYAKGKRDGLFTAYGKIGEIVYSKSFINDKLEI